tara:strand:+ start:3264 stop:3797 length:534 start_codon:yes stop_codon:yes gene_type:complete
MQKNTTTQMQVSSAGRDCEQLLHGCIDGDYTLLPAFAERVWEWFAETPRAADPAVMARDVGHKAAFLLFSMNGKFNQQTKALQASPRAPVDGPLDIALLVGSGLFLKDPYMWAICAAWVSMRMLSAMKMLKIVQRTCPLPECVVLAHAYFVLRHPPLLSGFHAIAWYIVWSVFSTKY